MKAYKGFDKNLKCHDFQYEVGKEYETDKATLCECGFHACENPLDCLNYYSPNDGCVYHEVEVSGDIEKASDDSKVAATSGNGANAEVKGKDAIAAVLGRKCKARGALGCWIVLAERDDDWRILGVQAVKVDGVAIKADTWYELRGGKVVEAEEGGNDGD
ncbi:MAG: hypothetical protein IIZ06_07425 [Kiritimatiellae bacterium]|nr:hypothetical protein [Kiritimatiellia bacterium]